MNIRVFGLLIAAMFYLQMESARADTANGNLNVQAYVLGNSCTLHVSGAQVGTYDPTLPTPVNMQSSLAVVCLAGTPWTLSVDQGQHAAAGSSCINPMRQVANGASTLSYSLYVDSARTQKFGCDVSNQATGSGAGGISVYGQIPANQTPAAIGTHNDVVVATLTF